MSAIVEESKQEHSRSMGMKKGSAPHQKAQLCFNTARDSDLILFRSHPFKWMQADLVLLHPADTAFFSILRVCGNRVLSGDG